ncbi:MAG: helix-turn-helix transcriptional regulator [Bacteroidota bacterium]
MNLNDSIVAARKAKGLTQQELAALTKTDLRTIQRIESGKSRPRAFTLRAIENALDFRVMLTVQGNETPEEPQDTAHFLHLLCLSCFSYLVIPYVHFLVPNYLLKRSNQQNPGVRQFAKKVIRKQIHWVIATMLVFLFVLLLNFLLHDFLHSVHYISYFLPFFGMYALNAILIGASLYRARAFAVQMP